MCGHVSIMRVKNGPHQSIWIAWLLISQQHEQICILALTSQGTVLELLIELDSSALE